MGDEFGIGQAEKIRKVSQSQKVLVGCLGCLLAPFALLALVLIVGVVLSFFSPPSSVRVTRAEYGERWPFTVASGTLWRDGQAIVFTADDGLNYAVNGPAEQQGYRDIGPIWLPGRNGIPKKDIGPMIERGNAIAP